MEARVCVRARMAKMRAQAIDCRCALRCFALSVPEQVMTFTSHIAYIDDLVANAFTMHRRLEVIDCDRTQSYKNKQNIYYVSNLILIEFFIDTQYSWKFKRFTGCTISGRHTELYLFISSIKWILWPIGVKTLNYTV